MANFFLLHPFISTILMILFFWFISGLRIINQYEREVILTLGKYSGTRAPGLTWILVGI